MDKSPSPIAQYRAPAEELEKMHTTITKHMEALEHEIQTLVDWYGNMTESPYIDQAAMDQMKTIYNKQLGSLTRDYHKYIEIQLSLKDLYEHRR